MDTVADHKARVASHEARVVDNEVRVKYDSSLADVRRSNPWYRTMCAGLLRRFAPASDGVATGRPSLGAGWSRRRAGYVLQGRAQATFM
jgi:hypothetical protein